MILCDTNIFISAFNGRVDTIANLERIGHRNIILSSVTVMELYQGMGSKPELQQMKKRLRYYDVLQINEQVSEKAIALIDEFRLSHHLAIPDALIGATAIIYQIPLYTYNIKDFNFIKELDIYNID